MIFSAIWVLILGLSVYKFIFPYKMDSYRFKDMD